MKPNKYSILPQSNTRVWVRIASWLWLGSFLCLAVVIWNQRAESTTPSITESIQKTVSVRDRSSVRENAIGKRPIESLRVGERVLAVNPQVTQQERLSWQEPDWNNWLQLSLVMPKGDGSLLEMEILRSEAWVRSALQPIVSKKNLLLVAEPDGSSLNEKSGDAPMVLMPLRGVYQDMLIMAERCCNLGLQLDGFTVDMDLHELAISGPAWVRDIEPCQGVLPGDGQVITATFQHSSGDVIDLVWSDDESRNLESIGTTSNHPFYSFDRGDYIQAGSLQEGERLLTYSGDTKRVVSKLARPGPETVYNLEVFGEHVYFIGHDGVLVHNSDSYGLNAGAPRSGSGINFIGADDAVAAEAALERMVARLKGMKSGGNHVVMEVEAFGSRAGSTWKGRGALPDSDLDIIIRDFPGAFEAGAKGSKKLRDLLDDIKYDFYDATGIKVDLKVWTDDPFMRSRMAPPFKKL